MEALKLLITEEDSWVGAKGEQDGAPFILRFRTNLQPFIDTKYYNKRLSILWDYETDKSSLMPDEETIDLIEEVESALMDALESDLQAILSFVYVGNGQQEWYWYSKDAEETLKRIIDALNDFEELPIGILEEEDPDWNEYKAVLENVDFSEYEESDEE